MQIAAFDADELADGNGKAAITWISKQLLKTQHRMSPSSSIEGGWSKSEMRRWLIEHLCVSAKWQARSEILLNLLSWK